MQRNDVPDFQWDSKANYFFRMAVLDEHIDGLQHVNNGCYVNWCEQAAWEHSNYLGLNLDDYQRLDRAMAVRHADYDYKASSYRGDRLIIGTWLSDKSAVQMKRHFQLFRESDAALILTATWTLVCIEISSGKPKRLPKEFQDAY